MTKISIIIPTHNRQQCLSRALASVLGQSCAPSEIIVVDDGSTDQTSAIVKSASGDIKYIRQAHMGVSAARNTGIRNASHDWIAFLDDDDVWEQEKLEVQAALLKSHPEYRIIHSNETWNRNGSEINQKKKHRKRGGYIFQDCLPLCVISPSTVMIHREVFRRVGMFDESLPACEDYDLWLRICSKYPVLYTPEKLVIKHGGHSDQLSRKYWGMDRFRITALANIIRRGELNRTDQIAALKTMHDKIHIFQNGAIKHGNRTAYNEIQKIVSEYSQIR